jgi:hypothetical protein
MLSFLTSALGGSLVGGLLNLVNGWSDTFRKERETKMQIALIGAQTESQEKTAAWQAFAESQKGHDGFDVPANVWPWVASVVTLCLGLVESLRRFTRPGLTWGLLVFLWHVYGQSAGAVQAALLSDITFGAFTAFFWWFGERYAARKGK